MSDQIASTLSWWIGLSREQLDQEAERRAREMSNSETGRKVRSYTIGWSVSGRKP